MDQRPTGLERSHDRGGDESDLALLQHVNAGDRAAFRELYSRYYHPLQRFLYRLTGQIELAQEGINDVMLVVWQKGRSFEHNSKVSTWIMGIAYRKGLKLAEKSWRWRARFSAVELADWNEPSTDAEERTSRTELEDLLSRAVRELPAKQRAVLELTYHYGYSYEEIAAICHCPVNTVKTRMFHARAKLRRLLPSLARSDHDGID